MKAASGELNLTVITIIAVTAVLTFFMTFLWPRVKDTINNGWDNIENVPDQDQRGSGR